MMNFDGGVLGLALGAKQNTSQSLTDAAHEAAVADGVLLHALDANGARDKKAGLRRGKWTPEEEGYANRLIAEFKVTLLTSHATRHTSHATRHTSHVTRHSLHLSRHLHRSVCVHVNAHTLAFPSFFTHSAHLSSLGLTYRAQRHDSLSCYVL